MNSATFVLDGGGTLIAPVPYDTTVDGEGFTSLNTALQGTALVMGATLGEGGMGIVRSGTQMALGREVAVKSVRASMESAGRRAQLYREAWVTGRLEHPNIVPVYAIGELENGRLAFVMKQIEGVPWTEVIHDPKQHLALIGDSDFLAFHLDVFETVCRAISYAHAAGVIHRDIKPDNIMLGRFGEVYVLDWGIAVAAGTEPQGPLPAAASIVGIEGTPGYMAPEMARADASSIGVGSDIFLLGATLHEVLTQRPIHQGKDVQGVLAAAFKSQSPTYGPHVPAEMGAIVVAATQFDPNKRFSSVETLRKAVISYREHRTSSALSAEAHEHGDTLNRLLQDNDPDPVEIAMLGAAARFGFEAALKEWPSNVEARQALDVLASAMVTHEIAHHHPNSAAAWLDCFDEAPNALVARVARAQSEMARIKTDAAELHRDANASRGARRKGRAAIAGGAVMTCTSWAIAGLQLWTTWRVSYGYVIAVFVLYCGMLAFDIAKGWGRHNRSSRNQLATSSTSAGGLLGVTLICALMGVPIEACMALCSLVAALAALQLGFIIGARMALSAVPFALGAASIAVFPQHCWWLLGAGSASGFGTMTMVWMTLPDRRS